MIYTSSKVQIFIIKDKDKVMSGVDKTDSLLSNAVKGSVS